MMSSTPDRSAGNNFAGGQAERPVNGEDYTESGETSADRQVEPEPNQRAYKGEAGADEGGGNDDGLKKKRIARPALSRTEQFGFWTLVATAVLAAATFALAIATADMARSTRTLATFAKQQAHDTQTALEVASRQASAAEEANRVARDPAISITNPNITPPSPNVKLQGSFGVVDVGRTPVFEVSTIVQLEIMPVLQTPHSLEKCLSCGKTVLFPASGFQGSGLTATASYGAATLTPEMVASIKAKSSVIYLTGRVDYKDADHRDHTILLCNFFLPDSDQTGPCAAGNSAE